MLKQNRMDEKIIAFCIPQHNAAAIFVLARRWNRVGTVLEPRWRGERAGCRLLFFGVENGACPT
jgi:hypothetical protein